MTTVVTLYSQEISNRILETLIDQGRKIYEGQLRTFSNRPEIDFVFKLDQDGNDFYDLANEVYKVKVTKRYVP